MLPTAPVTIPHYQVVQVLGEGHSAVVYRAYRLHDPEQRPLTLKVFKNSYLSPGQQERLRRELHLLQRLESPYLVSDIALEEQGGLLMLVSPYDDLYLLQEWLQQTPFAVELFLKLAMHLTRALEDIHRQGVMHGDLKPSNILTDAGADRVKLIDFGMAHLFEQAGDFVSAPEGTLLYIAPEQTGRTGKPADYRSDFYALGVTLFQVATGSLPFTAPDRLSLIHAHLAVAPPRPADRNPALPDLLSDLILRLMAKNPEERYQTAAAIRADLERCLAEWQAHGAIAPFALGAADRRQRIVIAPGLYGRDQELALLKAHIEQIGRGPPALALIAGAAGTGKSKLAHAAHAAIVELGGLFITATYDQAQANRPYSALVRALQTLIGLLLREPAAVLQEWQARLQAAVGVNGQALADMIPEVTLLLGPQPPLPTLPPEQAQGRLLMTLSNFLRACGSSQRPLALFLDDLHRADADSLDFLPAFLTERRPAHLLIIAAYRTSEGDAEARLQALHERLQAAGAPIARFHLGPLDRATVDQLLADTFAASGGAAVDTARLAERLYRKSGGNPFFLSTLFRALVDAGLFRFTPDAGWIWDDAAIQAARLSADVTDLVVQGLDRLPAPTLELLKQAACLGSSFPAATLALISGLERAELDERLAPALREDVVRADADDLLRFEHSRVHEAICHLMDAAERQRRHWQIGRLLHDQSDLAARDDQLFVVVNQLNQGRDLADAAARAQLSALNYRAGLKARASGAFDTSLGHLQISGDLLPPDAWQRDYPQTYAVWSELLLAHALRSNYAAALAAADALLAHARSDLDRARCYRLLVMLYAAQADAQKALAVGNTALTLYGQPLPVETTAAQAAVLAELRHLAQQPLDRAALARWPEMRDPAALMQIAIRYELIAPLYRINPELFVLNNLQMIRLGLEHGSHSALTSAFGGHASALIAQGEIDAAARFSDMAAALWERYPDTVEAAQTMVAAAWGLSALFPDMAAIRALNQRGQTLCRNSSLIHYWGISLAVEAMLEVVASDNLPALLTLIEAARDDFFHRYRVERYQGDLEVIAEVYLKPLAGMASTNPSVLEQRFHAARFFGAIFHLHILTGIVAYVYGDFARACDHFNQANDYRFSNRSGLINPAWKSYHALALLALAQTESSRNDYVEQAKELLARVETLTAIGATFRPHAAFVRAELAYTRGDATWHSSFIAAIEQAAAAGYTLVQASLHERMAVHLLAAGHRFGRGHIEEAVYLFAQCGAAAKAQQLQQTYAPYFQQARSRETALNNDTISFSSNESSSSPSLQQNLDLYAILKASQAIASEIDTQRVLETIMRTIGEVSGAQTAYLIMEPQSDAAIVARYPAQAAPALPLAVRDSGLVSPGVVRYVQRTRRTLLLDDASHAGEFTNDPHISAQRVRALLCHPIQEQSRLLGIIYLENNLSTHAFTTERVEVVRLLATQAAISITNSQAIAARSEQERVQRELEIAHEVQQRMLPHAPPHDPDFEIAGASLAARQVSGDLYGYYQRPNGGLAVAVGDVTGKGMPAALLMGAAVVALAGAIEADLSPGPTLARAHRVLRPYGGPGQNVAICLAFLDGPRVRIANAGAVAPVVRSYGQVQMLDLGGLPLGTPLSDHRPYREATLLLTPGDLVVLCSDGLIEATSASGERFGFERFEATIASGPASSAEAMLRHLMDAVAAFGDAAELHDDITALVIRRRAG